MPTKKPKPNQPCNCGSGKKYKKCCKVEDDISSSLRSEESASSAQHGTNDIENNFDGLPQQRFKIGDRVLANVDHKWLPGVIVKTNYREPDWPKNRVSPYQILLDGYDNRSIYAPFDGDKAVQRYDESKDEGGWCNKKTKKKGGKKQLREEARLAEEQIENNKAMKTALYIPELGNNDTVQDEFGRSGMLEATFLRH